MLLSQDFLPNSPFATPLYKASQNPIQSTPASESQDDFDTLLSFHHQTNTQEQESYIPLNEIAVDISLALGLESQNPKEDLRFSTFFRSSEFLKSLDKEMQEELNPLSYPRSLSVIGELMNEKLEEFYATTKDPNDPKLHLLLSYKEQLIHLDSTMQELKDTLTNKAELLTCLHPYSIEQKSDLFLDRAQEVQKSASNFKAAAQEGVAWIRAFFSEFEADLSQREKDLIFKHAKIIQTHWHLQTGGEDGKITLENGMVYQEYLEMSGFTLTTQNLIYAYTEKTLKDGTTQVILQIYEKATDDDTDSNIFNQKTQKPKTFQGQNLKLIGEASRIEKRT
ncbi:hypothetical protein [Helicobacter sp.]|uniref:hypothetical protein n=1 Tax=Helicobacter sp. TaxID=218 RepID=UPI0019847F98|nr:hypothetical protein [Helicobacter sp.]MBD5166115.1 hypothetical protein [Helicobacter sp.]